MRISVHPPRVVVNGGGSVAAGPPVVATAGPLADCRSIGESYFKVDFAS